MIYEPYKAAEWSLLLESTVVYICLLPCGVSKYRANWIKVCLLVWYHRGETWTLRMKDELHRLFLRHEMWYPSFSFSSLVPGPELTLSALQHSSPALALNAAFVTVFISEELVELEVFICLCSLYYRRVKSEWSLLPVCSVDLASSVALFTIPSTSDFPNYN